MPIFRPASPITPAQHFFNRAAAALAAAGCCGFGFWEARSAAQVASGYQAGYDAVAALLFAIAISLGGLCFCLYWRTRALGISLLASGLLSYAAFLGGAAYLARRGQGPGGEATLESIGPNQQASVVIYFRKGTTNRQIEDFHTTVLEQPGQPMHPEPDYPWFVIDYLRLVPAQANGFDAAAVSFRKYAAARDTGPYIARVRSDPRVDRVFLNVAPLAIHISPSQP